MSIFDQWRTRGRERGPDSNGSSPEPVEPAPNGRQEPGDLEESWERYRRLVELSPDGIVLHQDGRIIYANQAAAEIAGVADASQIVGQSVFRLMAQADQAALRTAGLDTISPERTNTLRVNLDRPDGSTIAIEVTSAQMMHNGRPATQSLLRDITETLERERLQEERLKVADVITSLHARMLDCRTRDELNDAGADAIESLFETNRIALFSVRPGGAFLTVRSRGLTDGALGEIANALYELFRRGERAELALPDIETGDLSEPARAALRDAGVRSLLAVRVAMHDDAEGVMVLGFDRAHHRNLGNVTDLHLIVQTTLLGLHRLDSMLATEVSEYRFLDAAEANAAAFYLIEPVRDPATGEPRDFAIAFANEAGRNAIERYCGDPNERLLSAIYQRLPQRLASANERYRTALSRGEPVEGIVREDFPDGPPRWVRRSISLSEQGNLRVSIRDITREVQAQRAVEESELRFRAAADSNPDSFLIFEPVRDEGGDVIDYAIVFANESTMKTIVRYSGREEMTLSGMLLGDRERLVAVLAVYNRVLELGEPVIDETVVERESVEPHWYTRRITPQGDRLFVTYHDITEERARQQRVADAEMKQRHVLEGLPAIVALLEWTREGEFVLSYGNPALFRMTGRDPDRALGRSLKAAGVPEADEIEAFAREAAEQRVPLTRDVESSRQGRTFWLRTTVVPEFDESGNAVRAVFTAIDLSDQRAAEAQARDLSDQLRAAADTNPDSFMIMRPVRDAGGTIADFAIVFENGAAREMRRAFGGRTDARTLSDMVAFAGGDLGPTLAAYVAALTNAKPREDAFSTALLGHDRWYQRRLMPLGDSLIVSYRETTEHVREVESLAIAEADRRAILEGLSDMVAVSDLADDGEFRVSYANQAYYEFFGFTPEGVIGYTTDEVCSGETRDIIRSASDAALAGPVNIVLPGPAPDQRRHVQVRIMAVTNEAGVVVRRIWRGTDITELRESRTVLEGRESHYEAILNGLADLICVSEPAEDGEFRLTYANPAYLEFMGVTAEQVIGKPRSQFQRSELYDLYDEVRNEAIVAGGPVARDLAAVINGRMRYGQVLVTPLFDEDGNCIRAIWRITDLTGQRESEAELDRAEAREQAILDGLSDFVYVLDRDGNGDFRFTHANRAAAAMGDPGSLLGKRLEDLLQGGDASSRVGLLQRAVRECRPASGEFELDFNGSQMLLDICATPVVDDDGSVNRVIWRATDLTDRRASETLFRAAATANLDPFSHLEPVYDDSGAVVDFVFRYSNAAGLELNRSYAGVERPERLSEVFRPQPAGFAFEVATYAKAMASGEVLEEELRTTDAAGRVRWLFRQVVPVEGGVIVSGRDITERKHRDEEMARAERLQRTVLEALNDGIALTEVGAGNQWRVIYANGRYLDMLGLLKDEVIGKAADEYLTPARAALTKRLRDQALETGAPVETENVTTVDGIEVRRIIRVTPLKEDDGTCTRAVWRVTDISEQHALQTRFQAAAEANLDAFMILTPVRDGDGTLHDFDIAFANRVAREGVLAYSGGAEPKRVSDMFHVAPQGFPIVMDQYRRAFELGDASQDETWSDADGGDRWFQRQLIPFSGGLVVTYREVTEMRRAHQAVAAAERNHRAILEGLSDAVVVSDRDGDGEYPITYANPAFFRLLGIPPDEVVTKGVTAFLPPELARAVMETRYAAIEAGGPIEREISGVVRGRALDIAARITPVFDDRGICTRLIWRLNDIGEARSQQRALEQAQAYERAILDNLTDGILLAERDEAGEYRATFMHPVPSLVHSYPADRYIGKTWGETFDGEAAEYRLSLQAQAIANRASVDFELEMPGDDGQDVHLLGRVTPTFNDEGVCDRLIWRYTDVTEAYEHQRAIQAAERNQRAILESLQDGIVVFDRDSEDAPFVVTYSRPLPELRDRYTNVVGYTYEQLWSGARLAERRALAQQAIERRGPVAFDTEVQASDGSTIYESCALTPVFNDVGVCVRLVWRFTDTSDAHRQRQALQAAEANQRAILESLTDIITVADRNEDGDFVVTYTNPARERVFGSPETILGRRFEDVVSPEAWAKRKQAIERAIETRGAVDYHTEDVSRGRTHAISVRLTPIFDGTGDLVRLVSRHSDVTEATRQQQRIEEDERFQRAILASLTDIIVVADRAADGRFQVTFANEARDRMAGPDDEPILGRHLDEYAAPYTLENVAAAIESREARDFDHHMVFGGQERDFRARVSPVFDDGGVCIRIILRYADQTETYQHQREIEAAERNQRAILDALSDVIMVLDRDEEQQFVVTYINAAREALTGRPDSQMLGKRLAGFLPPEGAKRLGRAIEGAIANHRTVDFEGTTSDRNDEPLFYAARITPAYDLDGSCRRIILRYSDVSAERTARAQFEESERNRQAIVENLADIVLLFDRDAAGDFRLSFANPPFFETGRTPEETLDQRFEDFLTPAEAALRRDLLDEALATGLPVERELTVDVRGRLFHYTTRVSPIFDDGDPPVCRRAVWRYTDISELVEKRERLAENERDQRAIIEGLSDALLVADRRDDGRWQVVHANTAHYEMTGEPAGSGVGRYLDDAASASADANERLDAIHRAVAGGGPLDVEIESLSGGHPRILARRVTPLFDSDGRCYRVIVRTTDVTERRMHDAMINRLGRIVDGATDEIYIVDATTLAVLQTNAAARRNLGYSEQEASSLAVADILVQPRIEEVPEELEALRSGALPRVTLDGRLQRKDGSTYPVVADVQYVPDEQPPVLLAIARDVSERRALEASLSHMAAIVESSADAVIGLDPDGSVGHWNPAATALFGYERADVLGRPLVEILGGSRWNSDGIEALARDGGTIDTSLPRRAGDEIDVSLTAFPVRDDNGRGLGTAIIGHDIRWRLEATQALRESESRFRSVFDQAPSGILIQRASDGLILDSNQFLLDLVEYPRDEIVGHRPIELGLVADPDVVLELDADLRSGNGAAPRELHIATRSGRRVEMFVTVERIELNGEPCFLSFLTDISPLRRAERELIRAQEGLRSITENLPLILTSWDNSETCTLAVGHGLELAGLDGEALIGRHMSEIVGPSARLDLLIETAQPGDSGGFEFSLAGRIFESQFRVLPDGSGTVSVAVDVTEQRATGGQLDAIVENAPITLFAFDREGIVLLAKGRAEGVLTFSPQATVGRSILDVIPKSGQYAPIGEDIRRALAGEQFSASYQTQSGRTIDVHYSPVRTADGSPAGAAAVIIDVTERLRAERAIRESNERFRQIAETATDGIVSATTDGRIVFANAALGRIFGYDLGELINQPLTILMPHELASAHRQGFRRYLDTAERVLNWNALELTGRRRDGTDFQLEMSLSEGMHDGDRVVTAFIRDITERRRTEEALMQAQKLESLGILAGGIAHDFNNMLVAIMGNAGLALADLQPESPVYETVQEIELAARRAAELARQMLAYSGKGRLAVSRIDLTGLVREIPHLLRSSIGKGVNLRYDLAENLPPVEADATQLRQVVMNLVINASDAIGNGDGVIAVTTGVVEADPAYLASTFIPGELKPGTYCYLEVADTGSGMAPETLARIFDPFFTTKFTGKGLGLAAVLGIVRGHRGTLKVESAPGGGTTFRMLLPVALGAIRIQPQTPVAADAWRGSGLLLVVDDEESVRQVTARAVRSMGFEPIVAVDGQDGVEQFSERHGDLVLVLMDLTMPRLNGEAAAARMREIDPDVPIVLMSGFDESEMAVRFRAAGVSGFVQKPFEIRGLRDAIRAAVSANK